MNLPRRLRFLITSAICLLLAQSADSQEIIEIAIHPGETMYVHAEDDISIFSDLTNSGSFTSARNSKINFFGEHWNRKTGSSMPDESSSGIDGIGGDFIFAGKASAPQYINSSNNLQSISGFPNISIANSQNIILEGSDLLIRNNLDFEKGHLILNNRNTVMGTNSTITGYTNNGYIITGTSINGGFLIRGGGGNDADIIFPVGTKVSSYTPVSLTYKGIAQNLKVRVFENVYDRAIVGISDYVYSVNKTWHVSLSNADPGARINMNIQHNTSDEGLQFSARRTESFIRRFQTSTDDWDISSATGLTPGLITSANPIPNAFVNSRKDIGGLSLNEYFSKSLTKGNAVFELRIPEGISPNNDGLNDRLVIQNLQSLDKVRIEIYNSGQSIVYKDINYQNTFEGIGNQSGYINQNLPNGIYYYIININDRKPYKGFILINK